MLRHLSCENSVFESDGKRSCESCHLLSRYRIVDMHKFQVDKITAESLLITRISRDTNFLKAVKPTGKTAPRLAPIHWQTLHCLLKTLQRLDAHIHVGSILQPSYAAGQASIHAPRNILNGTTAGWKRAFRLECSSGTAWLITLR